MIYETWSIWKPKNLALEGIYKITSTIYDLEAATLIMESTSTNKHKIRVVFDGGGLSFTKSQGILMQPKIDFLKQKYGKAFYSSWSFFVVSDSKYFEWTLDETCGMRNPKDFIHFAIVTESAIFEVIGDEPIIEFIQ